MGVTSENLKAAKPVLEASGRVLERSGGYVVALCTIVGLFALMYDAIGDIVEAQKSMASSLVKLADDQARIEALEQRANRIEQSFYVHQLEDMGLRTQRQAPGGRPVYPRTTYYETTETGELDRPGGYDVHAAGPP